jgi:hypothetical protein
MAIILDRSEIIHYGYYTDDEGTIYPFSVELAEKDGNQEWIEIVWDDDQPENVDDIEDELRNMF